MNDFLERELREALRSKDPGEDFTRKVMAHIDSQAKQPRTPKHSVAPRALQWLPAAMAASLLMAIVIKHEPAEPPSAQQGLHAREQLLHALRVTSEKLDLAYQVVHDESRDDDRADAGA